MVKAQVIQTEDGTLYLARANSLMEIDENIAVSLNLDEFNRLSNLETDYNTIFTLLKIDIVDLKKILQKTKNPNKLYTRLSEMAYLTNFKQVKAFTKSMTKLLETLNKISEFNLFTRERRRTFLRNLKELLDMAGYKLFVVDYTGDEIVFRVQHPDKKLSQLYKIDATSYNKLENTTYLKDVIEDFETLKLFAPERIEVLLEDLKLFKA